MNHYKMDMKKRKSNKSTTSLLQRVFISFIFVVIITVIAYISRPRETNTVTQASTTSSVYYGAYIQGWQNDFTKLTNFETTVGKQVSILNWFIAWGDTYKDFQTANMNKARNHGSIPLITWEPWNYSKLDSTYTLKSIINGSHDAYITKWANDAKLWGQPFFLRFAHEMDGDWYAWSEKINGNTSGEYVQAWKHIHDIFIAQGVTNATWVWCPFRSEANNIPIAGLYPGDAYVDWTCMDGYNWGTSQSWSHWETFTQVFQQRYNDILQIAPSKPIMIAETGSVEGGGNKSTWLQDAFATQIPTNFPRIKAVVYFNRASVGTEPDWRIETSAASIDMFKQSIGSDVYASNEFMNINSSPIPALNGMTPQPTTTNAPTIAPSSTSVPTVVPTAVNNDTQSPTVRLTYPLNGSSVSRGRALTITATAADNVGISKVEFYVSNKLLCIDTTVNYSCLWSVPSKRSVSYTVQAKAYDNAGNTSTTSLNVTAN
jgi:beta-mannanase